MGQEAAALLVQWVMDKHQQQVHNRLCFPWGGVLVVVLEV